MSTTPSPSILRPALRTIGAVCLVLGPLTFTVADLTSPDASGTPGQLLRSLAGSGGAADAAIVASLASAIFFIAGMFLLLARPLQRGQSLLAAGVGLALYALLANTVLLGVNIAFVAMADPSLDGDQMTKLMGIIMSNPIAPVVLGGHLVLVAAFLLYGLGLSRAGIGPVWGAVCIALCGVVDAIGGMVSDAADTWAGLASDTIMITGFATMAWFLQREHRSTPAPDNLEVPVTDRSAPSR